MAYIPVALTARVCVHCQTTYYAKHKRRIYCSNSCNTLAWMARQSQDETSRSHPPLPVQGALSFSAQNIATVASATALTAAANYVLNDRPAQTEIMAMIKALEEGQLRLERKAASTTKTLEYLVDYVNAQMAVDMTLPGRMTQAKLAREQHRDKLLAVKKASLQIRQQKVRK